MGVTRSIKIVDHQGNLMHITPLHITRRNALRAGLGSLALAAAPRVAAAWDASERYPDPAIKSLDPSFDRYRLFNASIERLATDMRWCEGPVYFGDAAAFSGATFPTTASCAGMRRPGQ